MRLAGSGVSRYNTTNGIVYCSKYISQDEALQKISDTVEGEKLTDPNFNSNRCVKSNGEKLVAVGLSSGFGGAIESTSIHPFSGTYCGSSNLCQMAIFRAILTSSTNSRVGHGNHPGFPDFVPCFNERTEPLYVRREMIPDSLQHKIELFRERRVFRENEELLPKTQDSGDDGTRQPKAYHPLADKMSDKELEYFLSEIRSRVAKTVSSLPPHDTCGKHYCPTNDVM